MMRPPTHTAAAYSGGATANVSAMEATSMCAGVYLSEKQNPRYDFMNRT